MPGGPWARGLPAELGAPVFKTFLSREDNPVQGNRTKARQAAARHGTDQPQKMVVGGASADWAQPGGLSALTQ